MEPRTPFGRAILVARTASALAAFLSTARVCVACVLFVLLAARAAHAEETKDDGKPGEREKDPKKQEEEKKARDSINVVPVAGGSSDIGFVVGVVGAFAWLKPGSEESHKGPDNSPYIWKAEATALLSFRHHDGQWQSPYQDDAILLTLPEVFGGALRLEVRPSYTKEMTQKYYGIGNASSAPAGGGGSEVEYGRTHPTLLVKARLRIVHGLYLRVGESFTYNDFDIRSGTRLSDDLAHGSAAVRGLLGQPKPHAVNFFEYALVYDGRDNETSTKRGQYHQALVRLSPGGTEALPYRYAQVNATARFYYTPIAKYLTFAVRGIFDALVGDPPFYELARFAEDTFALGGSKGVRGVPAQRYYGKIKAFGNVEARSEFLPFHALGKDFVLGAAAFFDGGRVWADDRPRPELDGTGIGLKYGVGGGLRLHQGETFVVRADVAYSPDAYPIGGYFELGEIF